MIAQDDVADLEGRYGTSSPWRRRALGVGVAAVVLAFAGWLAWATFYHAEPDASSQMVSFEVVDDHTVTAVVNVDLADPQVQARCLLRAYAEDHSVVGEVSFEPDPVAGPQYVEQVRTERLATAVESLGCTTAGHPRPR